MVNKVKNCIPKITLSIQSVQLDEYWDFCTLKWRLVGVNCTWYAKNQRLVWNIEFMSGIDMTSNEYTFEWLLL